MTISIKFIYYFRNSTTEKISFIILQISKLNSKTQSFSERNSNGQVFSKRFERRNKKLGNNLKKKLATDRSQFEPKQSDMMCSLTFKQLIYEVEISKVRNAR